MLQGLADTARAVFGARATSIMVADEATGELVFAAVSGEGADTMPGRRVPATQGIAGWVLAAGQSLVVEDVLQDPRFAESFARSTGYVPKGIMTAPLLGEDGPVGVMSVLDRPRRAEFSLIEVELLERFCHLATLALAPDAEGAPAGAPVSDLAAAVAALPPRRRAAAERLVDALTAVLEG
jgi:GAF domain-containing protein